MVVYEMLGQTSGVSPSTPKQGKNSYQYMSANIYFPEYRPRRVDLCRFDLYLWGYARPLVYSAPTENEETLYQHIFKAWDI
jgi:hypothetical protein